VLSSLTVQEKTLYKISLIAGVLETE